MFSVIAMKWEALTCNGGCVKKGAMILRNFGSSEEGGDSYCTRVRLWFNTLQIHTTGETGTPAKKCKSYKYLPYTLQCRSVDVNQYLHFSTVLGAVIKWKLGHT